RARSALPGSARETAGAPAFHRYSTQEGSRGLQLPAPQQRYSCPPCFLITSASSSLLLCLATLSGVSPFWFGTFTRFGFAFSKRSTTIASPSCTAVWNSATSLADGALVFAFPHPAKPI